MEVDPSQIVTPREVGRWKTWQLVTGSVVALVIGVGIGGAGEPPDEVEPTPEVRIQREEVVRPGCLTAIDEAERVGDISSRFAFLASEYPPMVVEAAQAGIERDAEALEDLTRRAEALTPQFESLADEMGATVASFNAAKAECRA